MITPSDSSPSPYQKANLYMLNFFKNRSKQPAPADEKGRTSIMLRHDKEVTAQDNVKLMEMAGKLANIPIFRGHVKHLYESDFTGYKDKCPRCNGTVLQMFSNFAYATQKKSRLLAAPAGLFCQHCPTVIIDDDIMRESIDRSRFQYYGVFSVEDGYSGVIPIDTINGVTPTFILDENQEDLEGILQSVHQPGNGLYFDPKSNKVLNLESLTGTAGSARKQKDKRKTKNKMAKQSRKANRKK